MTDYYAILGVNRNATQNEIRDAYLRLARDTHPDKVKDPEARKKAENLFKNVTAAYDTLSRDRTRREYSARLPEAPTVSHQAPRNAPPMVQAPPLPPREGSAPVPPANQAPAIPTPSGRVSLDLLGQGIEAFKKQDFHTAV
ncbi:MAG: DnaJ domain-containing protein, partial [Vicinamibacteria bacterium]